LLCVQWITADDGQRNCPKHVEFYSKNKLKKLVHLVGFIIRIYQDARSPERQIRYLRQFLEGPEMYLIDFPFTYCVNFTLFVCYFLQEGNPIFKLSTTCIYF